MDIRIYQIDSDHDEKRIKFLGLDNLENYQGSVEINSTIYKQVFDGTVDCKSLEDVFHLFNTRLPIEYRGHSLSVSDIVEVVENSGDLSAGFYFCDSWGFQSIPFDKSAILNPEEHQIDQEAPAMLRILVVEPMKEPYVKEIPHELSAMHAIVGGYIEAVYPFEDPVAVVCNEEGKLQGLPYNRVLKDESGKAYDVLCGTFFVVGLGEENFTSLTEPQIEKYTKEYSSEYALSVPKRRKETQHER